MPTKTLISVRSNCNFALNYENSNLVPQVELILLSTEPSYSWNKKGDALTKGQKVEEFRIKTDLDSVNRLIGELQIVVKNLNNFEQLSGSFNALIDGSKSKQESKTDQ